MSRPSGVSGSGAASVPDPVLSPQQREWADSLGLDLETALVDPQGLVHAISLKDGNEWWIHPEHKVWAIVGHKPKSRSIAWSVATWKALDLVKMSGWRKLL